MPVVIGVFAVMIAVVIAAWKKRQALRYKDLRLDRAMGRRQNRDITNYDLIRRLGHGKDSSHG